MKKEIDDKWFYPLQKLLNGWLKENYDDWICMFQDVSSKVMYEQFQCIRESPEDGKNLHEYIQVVYYKRSKMIKVFTEKTFMTL
jgi:hypothetical protein